MGCERSSADFRKPRFTYFMQKESSIKIPAYAPKEVVDATGCGDTYVLGYLYMRNKGASYEEAGCFAAAMSTIKLEKSGPFSGTEEEVWHILKNNKQKPEVLVAQ